MSVLIVSIFALMGCQKEFAETLQSGSTNDIQATFSMKDAKDFLTKSKSPFSKASISFVDHNNKKDEMKLFWDIRNTYNYNGITYMEVPFTALNNMVTYPTHTLVFWKKENGQMEARFKTYQYAKNNNGLNAQILLESIYDLKGKHIKTNAHQKGKKKKVEVFSASTPMLMAEGGCTVSGFTYVYVHCEVQGADWAITCRVNYEPYLFYNCQGGANSEDSEDPGNSGGGGGGNGDNQVYDPEPELPNDEIVDVQKLFNCFDNIPNAGATYSVRLLVDIPVNGNSYWPVNIGAGINPGHTFLELTKTNGNQSITQTFGFYPESGPKSVAFASPVPSAIKNDGEFNATHEYNASYSYGPISASSFSTLQSTITSESQKLYDLNNYNCSHFATNVLNSILEPYEKIEPLGWPFYHPITNQIIYFSNSPSGLYNKFEQMQNNGTWSAYRIALGVNENAKTSKGECE